MRLSSVPWLLLTTAILCAQAPPEAPAVLENAGKPMRIPFQCTPEDLHAFGLICPPDHPCPVYLELASVESVGNRLFLAGNLHADATTFSSILLASDDGGKTWREPYQRVRASGLELIQFIDFETGWIGGESLGSVPRDPFFLLTRDGGKTWYSRPVYGELREGAVDYFRFDSKTHGMLWIDRSQSGETGNRYETYESMTGGESWMLREASDKPLRKGPRPASTSGWRLRTDPTTKAYRLERHTGTAWESVAEFVVHAGDCREQEAAFSPEPPPAEPEQPAEEAAPVVRPSKAKPSLKKPKP